MKRLPTWAGDLLAAIVTVAACVAIGAMLAAGF